MPLLTNIILEAVDRAIEQIKNAHRLDHLFSKMVSLVTQMVKILPAMQETWV